MIQVSDYYKQLASSHSREPDVLLLLNGQELTDVKVVDFSIEEILCDEADIDVGYFTANSLTLKLKSTSLENTQISIGDAMSLSIRFNGPTGYSEYVPLGVFYVDSTPTIKDSFITIIAYDSAIFADDYYSTTDVFPKSMQSVFTKLVTDVGYNLDASVIIDPTYVIPYYNNTDPMTYREMIGYIAGVHGANAKITRDGKLKFVYLKRIIDTVDTLLPSQMYEYNQTNYGRTVTNVIGSNDSEVFQSGSMEKSETLFTKNPFLNQDIVDDINTKIDNLYYSPITIDYICKPYLEVGDSVTVSKYTGVTWTNTNDVWSTSTETWSGTEEISTIILKSTIVFSGGLKATIVSNGKSGNELLFDVDGTLSRKVNVLNRTAIKEDKVYYGVRINSDDGILVLRDDQRARVTLNADSLTMQTGDGNGNYTDALYFDALSGKYKFVGDVDIDGAITLGAGSYINWAEVNSDPDTATALSTANSASGTASSALSIAQQIVSGTYVGGTFIDSRKIYSPEIYTNILTIQPRYSGTKDQTFIFKAWDSVGTTLLDVFSIKSSTVEYGQPSVVFSSTAGAILMFNAVSEFNNPTYFNGFTQFLGNVDFTSATVSGLSTVAKFG